MKAVANTAQLQYNYGNGSLSSVQRTNNGKAQTYGFTYDSFGNMLTAKVGSKTLTTNTYGYNNGPLKMQTYGNGDVVYFTYDSLRRIQTASYDGGYLNYVYNGEGRLHSLTETNGSGSVTDLYTYDSIGRLIHSEQQENGTSVLRTSQNYNANNQLTGQSWQVGSTAYSEGYTYNSTNGNLNTMTTGVGTTLTMGYDGLRRLTSVSGGPVARQFTYRDIDSTKTTLQVASVTSGGQKYSYTYDSMGNIATYVAPGKGAVTYTYDNQGQLLKAAGDTTYTYTYDGAGNILTASNGTTSHTYTYGNTDWKDLLTAFDGNSITYDAIGNPTSYYNGTRWNFTWANGRSLATASDGTNNLSFAYDAGGLRTRKIVGGVTHNYLYAGGKLMRETYGSNTLDFFYDANEAPYALKYNGTVYYYITNLQGDVMRIVNASGTVMASYDYDPYGKVISATGTLANVNSLRYRGYIYDQETGFYYLNSRYYDPAVGRFINADSTPSTGQDISGNNMFAYCGNNPVIRKDNGGEFWNIAAGAIIGGSLSAAIQIAANLATGENWSSGVILAAATGAASGALSASRAGKAVQAIGNGIISLVGETINQAKAGTLTTRGGLVSIAKATGAGVIGGFIGGNGMRHKSSNYYKAAQSAKETALKVFGKSYRNAGTPAKLLSRAIRMVKSVGYRESITTSGKFILGSINAQILTRIR